MSDPLVLPVFPLEGVILFPRTMLPLHIFEPRYQQMVRDLLNKPQSERLIVIANMEDEGKPKGMNPFSKVSSIGKLVHHEPLEDGRSNIVLYGQFTAEVEEVIPSSHPYRTVKIKSIREEFWKNPLQDHNEERKMLMNSINNFMERTNYRIENLEGIGIDDLVNGLSFSLNLEKNEKQELLEAQAFDDRLNKLIEIIDNIGYFIDYVPSEDEYTALN